MRPSHAIAPGDSASFSPQIFFNARACGALVGDSGMTQPGACRSAAVPKRDARADAPEVERTVGSYRLPAAPLSSKNFRGPEVLRPRLTAGLPLSAFGPKAAVHSIRVEPTPFGCSALYLFQKSTQACAACAKYRRTQDRNKGEFVAHRRHNSWSACAAVNELVFNQRGAGEISRAPLRLMSHALRAPITHAPALRDHQPTVNAVRANRYGARSTSAQKIREVRDTWRCMRCVAYELVRSRAVVRQLRRRHCGRYLR